MDVTDPIPAPSALLPSWSGRGTRTPDMARFFAVLAARQRVLPTARAMRMGVVPDAGSDPADRLVRLFASGDAGRIGGTGAFHGGVAGYLTGRGQCEDGVYRGA